LVQDHKFITKEIAVAALDLYEVDSLGLDRLDKQVLITLIQKFEGRPVGLSTLAIALGEEPDTIESVVEPFLLREGLIERTPKGRQATALAHKHLGLPYNH
jgi:Holliday junction DNA helicase RuvB